MGFGILIKCLVFHNSSFEPDNWFHLSFQGGGESEAFLPMLLYQ